IYPPIEEVIYLPESELLQTIEPEEIAEPYEPEAVAVFLARQEAFAAYALPVGVCFAHDPLPIDFVTPLYGRVTSPFGFRHHPILGEVRFHFGTDVAAYTGTPFLAFADGRVMEAGYVEGFGLLILLDHGGGIYTRYAHASALYVQAGDVVVRGERIGRVGMTGGTTGPHLHFELEVDGGFRNPEFYVNFN
ncbi:MAG: M23 family metallopeptidase, partial [Oscillospiraceae bacterium]|nr:M23 family metallopeptidase [Oscillospiraceae bacterium]